MEIVKISLDKIIPPEIEMRETMSHDGLQELMDSIRVHGLRAPINVRPRGEFFEVVAGARRFEALKALGFDQADCVVVSVDEKKCEEIKIHENLKREDVDPCEEGAFYHRLVYERGWDMDELAKATGRPIQYLDSRLEIYRFPGELKAAISSKGLSLAAARELMKFRDEQVRMQYIRLALDNGATARTIESWRLQHEAANMPAPSVAGADGGDGAPPKYELPTVFCGCCGRDTKGMAIFYIPVDFFCKDALERRLREQAPPSSEGAGARP